jgi:hypothetical protein
MSDGYKIVFEGACSAYPCQTFVIKLLTMFATTVYQIFGIHDFVMLILVI